MEGLDSGIGVFGCEAGVFLGHAVGGVLEVVRK